MSIPADRSPLEEQIAQWRGYLRRRRAIDGPDVEELEGHLRDQVAVLTEAGLTADEAFLVAVKRMGSLDELSREFAREHSERLWKQLVIAPERLPSANRTPPHARKHSWQSAWPSPPAPPSRSRRCLVFGSTLIEELPPFYFRNASLFVLPLLIAYFVVEARDGLATALLALVAALRGRRGLRQCLPVRPARATPSS